MFVFRFINFLNRS